MVPIPMRPAQNALVTLASFLVAGALLPWSSRVRLACAAGAIGIVLFLFLARMRAHTGVKRGQAEGEVQAQIERIRAERAERMGKGRRE